MPETTYAVSLTRGQWQTLIATLLVENTHPWTTDAERVAGEALLGAIADQLPAEVKEG